MDFVLLPNGSVLCAELSNRHLVLLTAEGQFVNHIASGSPFMSLSLYNETLWVGCGNKTVKVFKCKESILAE